jgi:NADPH-dependent 2,4-dienoyl-CoA reductase/sulfur reductase-like enzyme
VRIAELQRWVCAEAGEDGWVKLTPPSSGKKVAVIGGGPSALSCAYYLSLAGYKVTIYGKEEHPGGAMWMRAENDPQLYSALQREVNRVMSMGIIYSGDKQPGKDLELRNLLENYGAVYLPEASLESSINSYDTWLGANWKSCMDQYTGQLTGMPGVFVGEEFRMNGVSVVEAVACGRRVACSIDQYLRAQAV